jgi:methylated-DNA-[protein]-cysteine S-methyltransferase
MTPIGELLLVACGGAVYEIRLPDPSIDLPRAAEGGGPAAPAADAVLDEARRQLGEYFAGERREFDIPLRLEGTQFQRRVWDALRSVSYGETVTYAQLARAIGRPNAARAVGAALASNPLPLVLPCHRVVGAHGDLCGFGGGIARKRYLLEAEAAHLRA